MKQIKSSIQSFVLVLGELTNLTYGIDFVGEYIILEAKSYFILFFFRPE